MRIAHIIPYLGERQGGPVFAVRDMTAALAERAAVTVHATPLPSDGPEAAFAPSVTICRHAAASLGGLRVSSALLGALERGDAAALHSHGLWTFAAFAAARAARLKRLPHILAPCGMLQTGALARSRWKKRLIGVLFQRRALRFATCLHAKSESEADSFRAAGLARPVAIIPNPVIVPSELAARAPVSSPFVSGAPRPARTLLYLGRLHPVKGLGRLVLAWNRLAARFPDWQLVLAGPDEGGFADKLRGFLEPAAAARVLFSGTMSAEAKWQALREASLFVMPSDFENFGSAIAEALSVGTPVVTTTATPWASIAAARAGWVVEPTQDALTEALENALAHPPAPLRDMGRRGKRLVEPCEPARVAERLMALYEWLTGLDARPDFVVNLGRGG